MYLYRVCRIALPIVLLLIAMAVTTSADTSPIYVAYELSGPNSSHLVTSSCPSSEVTLYFVLTCRQPGTVFDTVGLNDAVRGDWRIEFLPTGRLVFSIFAPGAHSGRDDGSGWHTYQLGKRLALNTDYYVRLEIENRELFFHIVDDDDDEDYIYEDAPANLRSTAVYAGDFPGDDYLGNQYFIHPAAIADIVVAYFGPYAEDIYAPGAGPSWVQPDITGSTDSSDPGLLITTEADTADWGATGGWLDDTPQTRESADSSPTMGRQGPATTPAEAVESFLKAQVAEDIDGMVALSAMELASPQQRKAAREIFEVIAAKSDASDLQFQELATAYGKQGNYAIVRCLHKATVRTRAETDSSTVGSLVITVDTDNGWKVGQFFIDDLLNLELEYRETIARPRTGLILASVQPEHALGGQFKTEAELSKLFTTKLQNYYFDESKTCMNELFSVAGWIPIVGDLISNSYTTIQTFKTIYEDLIPAFNKGDFEMVMISQAQVGSGIIQIAVESIPFLDFTADQLGTALDNYKHRVNQIRAISKLKVSVKSSYMNAPKKYLYLHPQSFYSDPERGFRTDGAKNIEFEYYDDWRFKPAPLKKVIFLSDVPLREWKTIRFDIGYYYTIKQSESEALFKIASDAGYPVHAIAGMFADYEVYIPMKLATSDELGPLVVGEAEQHEIRNDPELTSLPSIETQGTTVLRDARLVTGDGGERFIQFKISHLPGPNQTIQIELAEGVTHWTQPLEIENRIFNAVSGILVRETNRAPYPPVDEVEIPRGDEISFEILGDTRSAGLRPPVLQDLFEVGVMSMDGSVAFADMGDFPDGLLTIEGVSGGKTDVICRYMSGNQYGPNPVEDTIEVTVLADDWVLTGVEFLPAYNGADAHEGLADCDVTVRQDLSDLYDEECWIKSSVVWNDPPTCFPDEGGTWSISGSITMDIRHPADRPLDDLAGFGGGQFSLGIQGFLPDGVQPVEWEADVYQPRATISRTVSMDDWCQTELGDDGTPTGRRFLIVRAIANGEGGYAIYYYESRNDR